MNLSCLTLLYARRIKHFVGAFPENPNPVSQNEQCRLGTSIHPTVQTVTAESKCEYVPVQRLTNLKKVYDVCWTVHHCDNWRIKNQLDATYFIVLRIGSTCFGHYYAHHQELATIMLITTLVVSFLVCCSRTLACSPDTTPTKPHLTSNLQQTKIETTSVVINVIVASSWWWA